jgi:hypothetical protein
MMIKLPAVTVRVIAGAAPVVRYRSTPGAVTRLQWPLRVATGSPAVSPKVPLSRSRATRVG